MNQDTVRLPPFSQDPSGWDEETASGGSSRRRGPAKTITRRRKTTGFEAVRRGRGRPGVQFISREAYEYAQKVLKLAGTKLSATRKKVLLIILRQLLNPDFCGARIRNRDYPGGRDLMSKMKQAMQKHGLMKCRDQQSYFSGRGQVFFPSPELLEKNFTGRPCKATLSGIRRPGKHVRRQVEVAVVPNEESGVAVSNEIVEAWKRGTGLRFDISGIMPELRDLYSNLHVHANQLAYGNIMHMALAGSTEIIPRSWEQSKVGMWFAHRPAIQCLQKYLVPKCLKSVDGRKVWRIDCKSFHVVLVIGKAAVKVIRAKKDFYGDLCGEFVKQVGIIGRDVIKNEVVGLFHGRTIQNVKHNRTISWNKRRRGAIIQTWLTKYFSSQYPKQWAEHLAKRRKDKHYLNRRAASVFYECVSAGLKNSGLSKIGILIHDGVVFSASLKERKLFVDGFSKEARSLLNHALPIKIELFR